MKPIVIYNWDRNYYDLYVPHESIKQTSLTPLGIADMLDVQKDLNVTETASFSIFQKENGEIKKYRCALFVIKRKNDENSTETAEYILETLNKILLDNINI